jgi:hypothetical protein
VGAGLETPCVRKPRSATHNRMLENAAATLSGHEAFRHKALKENRSARTT